MAELVEAVREALQTFDPEKLTEAEGCKVKNVIPYRKF